MKSGYGIYSSKYILKLEKNQLFRPKCISWEYKWWPKKTILKLMYFEQRRPQRWGNIIKTVKCLCLYHSIFAAKNINIGMWIWNQWIILRKRKSVTRSQTSVITQSERCNFWLQLKFPTKQKNWNVNGNIKSL